MTPATDGANAPPGNSRFEAIASSTLTGRFFGVPFFRPSVSPALLFNVWAYLLGPFAFFLFGLWRKGIVLLAVGLFLYAPLILPTDASALTDILIEAYTPYYHPLPSPCSLSCCSGSGAASGLCQPSSLLPPFFCTCSFHTERLYIGLLVSNRLCMAEHEHYLKALFQVGLFPFGGAGWASPRHPHRRARPLVRSGLPLPASVPPRRGLSRLLRHDGHL